MTTTREHLEAMIRADWRRASRAPNSMHRSWLDVDALAAATRALEQRNSERPLPDWLTELLESEAQAYEATPGDTDAK